MDTKRIITFLVGAAVGTAFGWSADLIATASPMAAEPTPPQAAPASRPAPSAQRQSQPDGSRALVVVIPADGDHVASSTIAVAGKAFGRPHGPGVRSVRIDLLVGGKVLQQVELAVHAARFAGVLDLPASAAGTDGELRISDPRRPAAPAVIRRVTIGPALSALDLPAN